MTLGVDVTFSLIEKISGLHGDFHLNPRNIISLSHDKPSMSWRELRFPGTYLPFVIKAGTYFTPRGKEYWYVTRTKPHCLVIELQNMNYKRLVLGFESVSLRNSALSKVRALMA